MQVRYCRQVEESNLPRLCFQSWVDDVVHDITTGTCHSVIIHEEFPQVRDHSGRNEINDLFRHKHPVLDLCLRTASPGAEARFPTLAWHCLAETLR